MPNWVDKVGGKPGNNKPKPKKQTDFYVGRFSYLEVGTVAVFGLEDMALVESLITKLSWLSETPKPIVISRMGENVPLLPANELEQVEQTPQMDFHTIKFTNVENMNLKVVFIIMLIKSEQSATDEQAYAYVNVRADRLGNLLLQARSGNLFNLSDYSTLVQSGYGDIPPDVEEKMQHDYLFGKHQTNGRVFPPLNEVT